MKCTCLIATKKATTLATPPGADSSRRFNHQADEYDSEQQKSDNPIALTTLEPQRLDRYARSTPILDHAAHLLKGRVQGDYRPLSP